MTNNLTKRLFNYASMILAGVSISIGAYTYLKVGYIVGAILFSVGLLAVIEFKFKLYTGYIKNFSEFKYFKTLACILLFNIIGCYIMSLFVTDNIVINAAKNIVMNKANDGILEALFNGFGCGFIITLAVIAKNRIALIIGIPAFILAGFTHSIADAFYYSVAWESISIPAVITYIFTVIGNFLGGICYKLGSEIRS